MSRPQTQSYTSQNSPNIVNGGLIDFQDNLQRGMTEYQSPNINNNSLMGTAQTNNMGGCITGPPAYLHVNGVTYKPVVSMDDLPNQRTSEAMPATLPPNFQFERTATRAPQNNYRLEADEPHLSQGELEEQIEDRVQQKVSEYMRRRLGSGQTRPSVKAAPASIMEERTMKRLAKANAQMRQCAGGRPLSSPPMAYDW